MNVLVYGSMAYDQIMDFPDSFDRHILPSEIKKLNVSFTVSEFKQTFGGTAGNIAYNLALLKIKPVLHAAVGRDFDRYESRFKKLGINISGVKKYPRTITASAYIITDKKDNQITGFFPGALIFKAKKPSVKKGDLAIIAPGNALEMLELADYYYDKKTFFIFDPGQRIINFTKNQLRQTIEKASLYVVNDYELSLTKKITGYNQVTILKKAGILITTLGAQGSVIDLNFKNQTARVKIRPAKPVIAKDPTGSGDAYRAGLIKGLVLNQRLLKKPLKLPWLTIGQLASLAGTYAVENYGTQNHQYTFEQFKTRYFKEFKLKLTR